MSAEFSITVSRGTGNGRMQAMYCTKQMMQRALCGLCLLAGLWQVPAVAQPVEIDKVIAIAEDGVILKSEFDERWQQAQEQIAAGAAAPPEDVLRKQILDQLVIENLQMQMAERNGIRVDDNE